MLKTNASTLTGFFQIAPNDIHCGRNAVGNSVLCRDYPVFAIIYIQPKKANHVLVSTRKQFP